MDTSRVGSALFLIAAALGACGGTVSYPDDASSDVADAKADQKATVLCIISGDAGDVALACGDWVSVDTIDFEVVDGGKKFNHETPCSGGVCVGTSCGVPTDAGVIAVVGSCETAP